MSKNKKWWYDKYDFNDKYYFDEKEKESDTSFKPWWVSSFKNPTKSWMSKLGSYSYSFGESKTEKYSRVLKQLQTSINVINKDEIVVKWSDGTNCNSIENNVVYLSPNDLITSSEVNDSQIDILTGEVYLSKMIKEQSSKKDFYEKRTKAEECLWQALEINIAKCNLEKDWPGFIPSVLKNIEAKNCDINEVQNALNKDTLSVEAIISGISWNLINNHNKVEIPEKYNECLDAAIDILSDDSVEKYRSKACKNIVEKIKSILKIDESSKKINKPSLEGVFGKAQIKNSVDKDLAGINIEEPLESERSMSFEGDLLEEQLTYSVCIMKNYSPNSYDTIVRKLNHYINYIKNSLSFIDNKFHDNSFGHLSGDIDENSLFKIKLKDQRIMSRREVLSRNNDAFCFLLDESGSMDDKMTSAKEVVISLIEGLKDKFNLSVYGHTAEGENINGEFVLGTIITEYFSPRTPSYKSICEADAKEQNFDGMAIKICGKKMIEDYPQSRKILFHISDGTPYTNYAHGASANNYVYEVCTSLKKRGVEVYCIGIENAFSNSQGKTMYGDGNFVVLDDVHSSINILCRFIQQICNKNVKTYA